MRSAAPSRASHRPAGLAAVAQHARAGARSRDARPQHRRDGAASPRRTTSSSGRTPRRTSRPTSPSARSRPGALGVCCAKLGEAEALAEGGVESLHITSPVVTPQAIARLIALNGKAKDVMVVVDHPANVDALAAAAAKAGKPLTVIVDIDPGMHRTGVATPDGVVELVKKVVGPEVAEVCRRAVLLRPPPAHHRLQGAQGRDRGAHRVPQGHPRQARRGGPEARHRHRLGHRHALHRRQARRLHRAAGRLLRLHGSRLQRLRPARRSTSRPSSRRCRSMRAW